MVPFYRVKYGREAMASTVNRIILKPVRALQMSFIEIATRVFEKSVPTNNELQLHNGSTRALASRGGRVPQTTSHTTINLLFF